MIKIYKYEDMNSSDIFLRVADSVDVSDTGA